MNYLYDIAVNLISLLLPVLALFDQKIRLFTSGRKESLSRLSKSIKSDDRTIWFHCASLGEFEQGRPLIEETRSLYPEHKLVLSFFSPSGYEVRKDYTLADVVVYLPLDTRAKVRSFLDTMNPAVAVFVKYEFWPNLLRELGKREVPVILISGIFRKDQLFFKPYGAWMRKSLESFTHFFVQNAVSKELLEGIGFSNVTLSGDTRFDRVAAIARQDNQLPFLDNFIKENTVLVAGSTWPKDERFLVNYINRESGSAKKYIIAPHKIDSDAIEKLTKSLRPKTALYSEQEAADDAEVFIVDTVGILTKIYCYGDLAYVGGGFDKEGIHNILEPAAFGSPLVIGPIYDKYQEAVDLVTLGGCLTVKNEQELHASLDRLFSDEGLRKELGIINKKFIEDHLGATQTILDFIALKI